MENMGYELEENEYEDLISYLPVNGKLLLTLGLYRRISKSKSGFVQKYLKEEIKNLKDRKSCPQGWSWLSDKDILNSFPNTLKFVNASM